MTAQYWDSSRPQNAYHRRCPLTGNLRIVCPLISISWNFRTQCTGGEILRCLALWGICEELKLFHRKERKRKKKKKFQRSNRKSFLYLSNGSIRAEAGGKGRMREECISREVLLEIRHEKRGKKGGEKGWGKITRSCTVVFSSLLGETRQAVELIGDKIEQFTCAAAKRRESVLSFDREARVYSYYHTYVCKYMRPIDFPCVSIIQSSVSLNNSSTF